MTQPFFRKSSAVFVLPVLLLLVPLLAMQFTDEVNWSPSDFVAAGVLLFGTAGVVHLILQKVQSRRNRLLLIGGTLLVLAVIWAELAVGIFGSPLAGS